MRTATELLAILTALRDEAAAIDARIKAIADQRALAIDALYELEAGSGPRRPRVAEKLRTVEPTASPQTIDIARRRAKQIRERDA